MAPPYSGPDAGRFTFIQGDICNYTVLKEAMEDTDIVIHSAAIVDGGTCKPEDIFAVLYTCNDFTFRANLARDDFGYQPQYSEEYSLQRTIQYYRREREQR